MSRFNKCDEGAALNGVHARIHKGQFFISCEFNTVVKGTSLIYLIATNEKAAHFAFDVTSTTEVQVSFNKQVTASVVGTAIEGLNVNDFSQVLPLSSITKDATLSDSGTVWECFLIVGGSGPQSTGGLSGSRVEEFILSTGDFYAIIIDNQSVTIDADISVRFGWYEPQN